VNLGMNPVDLGFAAGAILSRAMRREEENQ
jgi:hypothetical protein